MLKNIMSGALGTVLWLLTGGLMFIHFIYSLFVEPQIVLFAVGLFIPPISLSNAISILITGVPITSHL